MTEDDKGSSSSSSPTGGTTTDDGKKSTPSNIVAGDDEESHIATTDVNNKAESTRRYPDCFYCPITKKIMTNPVVDALGNSIDESALVVMMNNNDHHHQEQPHYPNRALKAYIEQEVKRYEDVGSLRGALRAWNDSIRSGLQKIVVPSKKYRPLPGMIQCFFSLCLSYNHACFYNSIFIYCSFFFFFFFLF